MFLEETEKRVEKIVEAVFLILKMLCWRTSLKHPTTMTVWVEWTLYWARGALSNSVKRPDFSMSWSS